MQADKRPHTLTVKLSDQELQQLENYRFRRGECPVPSKQAVVRRIISEKARDSA